MVMSNETSTGSDAGFDVASFESRADTALLQRVQRLEAALRAVRDELLTLYQGGDEGGEAEGIANEPNSSGPIPLPDGLSSRRREVALMRLDGLSVEDIADRLDLSPHTVRNHLKAVYRITGVHSSAELVRRYRC